MTALRGIKRLLEKGSKKKQRLSTQMNQRTSELRPACPWRDDEFLLDHTSTRRITEEEYDEHFRLWYSHLASWPVELLKLKAQRRQVHNRVYAYNSRQKKRLWELKREQKIKHLKIERLALLQELYSLKLEVAELKHRRLVQLPPCPYSHDYDYVERLSPSLSDE